MSAPPRHLDASASWRVASRRQGVIWSLLSMDYRAPRQCRVLGGREPPGQPFNQGAGSICFDSLTPGPSEGLPMNFLPASSKTWRSPLIT